MKSRNLFFMALLPALIFMSVVCSNVNVAEKETVIFDALLTIINQGHYHPKKLNDEFSKKAFDYYLDNLDGSKRFFLQSEIEQLKKYQDKIDDQAKARDLEFFNLSVELLDKGIARSQKIYEEVVAQPLEIIKAETLELDGEKRKFANNEAELKDYWRKTLKYEIVRTVQRRLKNQEEEEDESKRKTEAELIEKAQEETKETFDDWFDRMSELRRSDRLEMYLNTFPALFDPHSGYYSPKEKQDFDMRMGGRLEGIGARLQREDDYAKVVSIVPGGPAWKGKELEVDDFITKVRQGDSEEAVDITGMRLDDAVQMIRGKKGTTVVLTVKKKDGSIVDIAIVRDEVILDEAFARSVILDVNESAKNIGYIKLPKFYSTFDGGNSCAADIKKELEKLTAQNVNGVILDLRYNGGGSLQDVVDMSGLFIEEGPIVQAKARQRPPYIYSDEDASVAYDGPLIVMVNTISASASEILAAALQDYRRAVIVGSNSTFGKGTVQRFFDLDRMLPGDSKFKPLGQVKLTMQKFYRIDGTTNQLKGVIPDIVLPDRFAYMDMGEKEYENALPATEIKALEYEQNVYQIPNVTKLRATSDTRVKANPTFNLIEENAARLKKNQDKTAYPISLEEFSAYMETREKEAKKYTDIMDKPLDNLIIHDLEADKDYIQADSSRIARHEDWLKSIRKDVYIEETMHIMRDMLKE